MTPLFAIKTKLSRFSILQVFLLLNSTGCSTTEAIEAATVRPAQLLGIEKTKGTLDYDTDADFVLLDDTLNVQATFIAGVPVFLNNESLAEELKKLA